MPDRALNVSPDLQLPEDAVTQAFAILAMIGAGKSNAGAVLGEEFYAAGLPFTVIDPKGDWWGLRSSGDGTGPGLPIPIFGGLHGDLPLDAEMGRFIADLIVDTNLTCILDVSEFPSKAAQMRFLTDFGDQLYRRHGREPQPRHLIMEEADEYLPQMVRADEAKCVGVWTRIAKRGRQRGLGFTIISQRSAAVNKDALSQCGTLIPLRTTGAHDRKAILDWISYQNASRDVVDSLPSLVDGEAYAISPHWLVRHGQPAVQRFRFRQRWTFDSGATPKVGEVRQVATLADIDLGALERRMAAVVEKAAADDPKALRKQIADLKRQLANAQATDAAAAAAAALALKRDNDELRTRLVEALARESERVEVPVLSADNLAALKTAIDTLYDHAEKVELIASQVGASLTVATATPLTRPVAPVAVVPGRPAPPPPATRPSYNGPALPRPPARDVDAAAPSGKPLGRAERRLLAVLAQFPDGRTRIQLSLLSGYSAKSSGYSNALGALRTAGLINKGTPIQITPEGRDAIGDQWEPLPTGEALVEHWMTQLGKAERTILLCLLDAGPGGMARDELAEATAYSPTSSGYSNALGRLRSLNLINKGTPIAVDPDFAREVGRG